MAPEQIIIDLTLHIRDRVRPHLGILHSRRVTGTAASGDATFAIDDIAEEAIVQFVERERLSIAYYSEDKGLMTFGSDPKAVLVIDPIDGTRPAVAGFEQCVVAVSWADYADNVTMGDVRYACVASLSKTISSTLYAVRVYDGPTARGSGGRRLSSQSRTSSRHRYRSKPLRVRLSCLDRV